MKNIIILLTFLWAVASYAVAPYGIKGQAQPGTLYSNVHQFPNNQVTNLGGINALVETGNDNLLTNPNFEHLVPLTGWTLTNGSSAAESSDVPQGKKALKISLTAQSLEFYQTSTLNATALADGANGSISLTVKTTLDNIYLCQEQAGVLIASTNGTEITNCKKYPNDGKWNTRTLPIILSGTSNGIRLVSLTPSTAASLSVTGDVYVDKGSLAAGDVRQAGASCNSIECETEFSATVSSTGVVSNENMNWINGNASLGSTGYTTLTLNSGLATVNLNCSAAILQGGFQGHAQITNLSVSSLEVLTLNTGTNNNTASDYFINCQKQGVDFTNAKRLGNNQTYSASNMNYSRTQYTPTFTGFGTVTVHDCYHSRDGQYLDIDCKFTAGTPTATEARISLPSGLTSSTSTGIRIAGRSIRGTAAASSPKQHAMLMESGVSYFTIGTDDYTNSISPFSKRNGDGVLLTGEAMAFIARIPIATWENSNQIIGSFKEVVTSIGSNKPDIQSVYFGSGADCSSACTTGTCTICNKVGSKITSVSWVATGQYNANGIDGTKYNCSGAASSVSGHGTLGHHRISSSSTHARIISSMNGNTVNAQLASLTCIGNL